MKDYISNRVFDGVRPISPERLKKLRANERSQAMTKPVKDNCPLCNANLIGDDIPAEQRHYYGNRTNFTRRIGIYDRDADCTVAYRCPDCGKEWSL